jgi:hypothetical protein
MPSGNISLLALTVPAAGALSASRFITQAGAYPNAGGKAFGVTRSKADAAGDLLPVDVTGTAIVETGAAVAKDDDLMVDASGRVVPLTVGSKFGVARAMEAAGASGALIEVLLMPGAGAVSAAS